MNRRSFLSMLAATAVLDPERLLWVPGKKTIFVPAPRNVVYWYRYDLSARPSPMELVPIDVAYSDWIHADLDLKEKA